MSAENLQTGFFWNMWKMENRVREGVCILKKQADMKQFKIMYKSYEKSQRRMKRWKLRAY